MATTCDLYHNFGLVDYRSLRTEYRGGASYHHLSRKETNRRCARCGSRKVVRSGSFQRTCRQILTGRLSNYLLRR